MGASAGCTMVHGGTAAGGPAATRQDTLDVGPLLHLGTVSEESSFPLL